MATGVPGVGVGASKTTAWIGRWCSHKFNSHHRGDHGSIGNCWTAEKIRQPGMYPSGSSQLTSNYHSRGWGEGRRRERSRQGQRSAGGKKWRSRTLLTEGREGWADGCFSSEGPAETAQQAADDNGKQSRESGLDQTAVCLPVSRVVNEWREGGRKKRRREHTEAHGLASHRARGAAAAHGWCLLVVVAATSPDVPDTCPRDT